MVKILIRVPSRALPLASGQPHASVDQFAACEPGLGRASFGFMRRRVDMVVDEAAVVRDWLIVDGTAAAIVQMMFALALDDHSPTRIARRLHEHRVPTRSALDPTQHWTDVEWNAQMVTGILTDVRVSGRHSLTADDICHDQIIASETFAAVQGVVSSPKRERPLASKKTLLHGLLYCHGCLTRLELVGPATHRCKGRGRIGHDPFRIRENEVESLLDMLDLERADEELSALQDLRPGISSVLDVDAVAIDNAPRRPSLAAIKWITERGARIEIGH